nr:MAG TPA: hypothetical protein [Caudoviricetes sp.]
MSQIWDDFHVSHKFSHVALFTYIERKNFPLKTEQMFGKSIEIFFEV